MQAKRRRLKLMQPSCSVKSSSSEGSLGIPETTVHHGNLILGRLGFEGGRYREGQEAFDCGGKNTGVVNSRFVWANMALAKDLLEKGETEIVLEYFELCSNFWKDRRGQLEKWTEEIKQGHVPDFRANLVY